jgi:hypothetical protein
MISAIAVYDITNRSRIISAANSGGMTLFSPNPLSYVEKSLLPSVSSEYKDRISDEHINGGAHHFILKDANEPFIVVICSERKLRPEEIYHLFVNIKHAHLRPHVVTLDEIIRNPIGFTGRDRLLEKTQSDIEDVNRIMLNNIDKVLQRHEKLDVLVEKSHQLELESLKFKNAAQTLNKPCCSF